MDQREVLQGFLEEARSKGTHKEEFASEFLVSLGGTPSGEPHRSCPASGVPLSRTPWLWGLSGHRASQERREEGNLRVRLLCCVVCIFILLSPKYGFSCFRCWFLESGEESPAGMPHSTGV